VKEQSGAARVISTRSTQDVLEGGCRLVGLIAEEEAQRKILESILGSKELQEMIEKASKQQSQ
jgi:hypothetical protein